MNRISNIAWLAGQAASGLTQVFPITLFLALLAGCGFAWDISHKRLRLGIRLWYLLLPGVGALLILLVGTLFEQQSWLSFLPVVLLVVGVILSLVTVARLRPAWMTSISVSLCFLWYSLWCCFVAGMSITGDWL